MKLDTIHHIAIIGHDYAKTREFYVDKLGFEQLDEHHRSDKQDILFNVRKGNLTLGKFLSKEEDSQASSPACSRAHRSTASGLPSERCRRNVSGI